MKEIIWKNEKRKIADLIPADYNPRKITDKQRADLQYSLETWGKVIPVVINIGKRHNVLIGGHQRVAIYAALGETEEEIDVRVPARELTLDEEKQLNVTLNQVSASFDWEKLFKNFDIEMLLKSGFGDEEMATMWDDVDLIDDMDKQGSGGLPEDPIVPRMQYGDVWKLGTHRLMNGDSKKPEDVARLMGPDLADMIYCDPPYDDAMGEEDWEGFMGITLENALKFAKENSHWFYWCDEAYILVIQWLYRKYEIENKRVCIWIKNNSTPNPKIAFTKVYEPCVYGTRGKPYLNKSQVKLNEILNPSVETGNQIHEEVFDYFNLWLIKRDNEKEYIHPTQKPLNLHQKPLRRCTAPGHIVLDLFGGSGSTMMACEQMGRFNRTMEIDPIMCEQIIRRWEEWTGKKAEKL